MQHDFTVFNTLHRPCALKLPSSCTVDIVANILSKYSTPQMVVVVSELLCYLFSKYSNSDVESIKKTVVSFYNSGEITTVKELIFKCVNEAGIDNDGLSRQVSRRNADNRAAVEVDDIVCLIEALDEKLMLDKLPFFTAQKLDRLPFNKSAEMDLFLAVRRIATLEEKLDVVMQQCSELASAVAGSKLRAPDVQNNGFITGHADLDNGESNSAKPLAAAGACDGGSSWASCCARPSVNDDGGFTEVSYKKAVKVPVQQKVVQVVRGTKKTTSGNAVISGVPRRLSAFVGRLHIDTTEDDLSKFLNDAGLDEAARLIFRARRYDHVQPLLWSLHWLRVPERISFRLAVLVYRCLHGSAPGYLASDLQCVSDLGARRRLRSSSTSALVAPRTVRATIGDRAFPAAAASVYHSSHP